MSEFTNWKDDQHFIHSEAVCLITGQDVLAVKVWWLNPPGFKSTRVSIDVPMMSADMRTIERLDMVAGWRCNKCNTLLFGTCIADLRHSPCCDRYVDASH